MKISLPILLCALFVFFTGCASDSVKAGIEIPVGSVGSEISSVEEGGESSGSGGEIAEEGGETAEEGGETAEEGGETAEEGGETAEEGGETAEEGGETAEEGGETAEEGGETAEEGGEEMQGLEDCSNGEDDDFDTLVDCEDPSCEGDPACAGGQGGEGGGGSCDGFCGDQSGSGCYCDNACSSYGDCCDLVCSSCPNLNFCSGGEEGNGEEGNGEEGGEPFGPYLTCIAENCPATLDACVVDDYCAVVFFPCIEDCDGDQNCSGACAADAFENDSEVTKALLQCGGQFSCQNAGNN